MRIATSANIALLATILLFTAAPARAYVDRAPSLPALIRNAQVITLVEVTKFNRETGGVTLKRIRDLNGKTTITQFKHQLSLNTVIPRYIIEWAQPGQRAITFTAGDNTLVCIGRCWYEVVAAPDGWWKLTLERPDLPLAYCGTISRLAEAIPAMVNENTAIITTIPHGVIGGQGATFDIALNRAALPGVIPLQRVRASMKMGDLVMQTANSVLGLGAVDEDDVPDLIKKLASPDAVIRAETADDLRTLGPKAIKAQPALRKLLGDESPEFSAARMAAASALVRIDPNDTKALETIRAGLESKEIPLRLRAARAAGLAGPAAGVLAEKLGARLTDKTEEDELVRAAALQAIAAIGPPAAGAIDDVVKLLDDPTVAGAAAEALGRMGPAARPAMKQLAGLLTATDETTRWAAVRGMAQIGGEEAGPAIDFMIAELQKKPTEWDGYNMMVYLALLGPSAEKAVPALQRFSIPLQGLRLYTMWVIQPETAYPWTANGFANGGGPAPGSLPDSLVFENYVGELGPKLGANAKVLAERLVAGTPGSVPKYGYHLLARALEAALGVLVPALGDADGVKRGRAISAIGTMGTAAAPAKEALLAAKAAAEGRSDSAEVKAIEACLKLVEGK